MGAIGEASGELIICLILTYCLLRAALPCRQPAILEGFEGSLGPFCRLQQAFDVRDFASISGWLYRALFLPAKAVEALHPSFMQCVGATETLAPSMPKPKCEIYWSSQLPEKAAASWTNFRSFLEGVDLCLFSEAAYAKLAIPFRRSWRAELSEVASSSEVAPSRVSSHRPPSRARSQLIEGIRVTKG